MICEKDEVHVVALVVDHVKILKSAKNILGGGVLIQQVLLSFAVVLNMVYFSLICGAAHCLESPLNFHHKKTPDVAFLC